MTVNDPNKSKDVRARVTLKDISKASGVALSTVSNALAGKSYVRKETREHVLKIAEQFGYRSSPLARSLRTGKTHSIGLLIADITNTYYAEIVRGAETALREHGYYLFVGNSDHDPEKEAEYVQHFLDQQVEGIILVMHSSMSRAAKKILDHNVPLILLNRRHSRLKVDLVGVDFRQGTQSSLQYMWDLGHRHIGFITGKSDSIVTRDRLEQIDSFRRVVKPNTLHVHVDKAGYSMEDGQSATLRLLKKAPEITAFVASQDQSAYGCLAALHQLDKRVPEEFSVFGFDDLPMSGSPLINLSTLHVDRTALGKAAAELLLERMQDHTGMKKTWLFSPELVVRKSTGRPRTTANNKKAKRSSGTENRL